VNNNVPAEFAAYDQEIMKVHDEVMPRMSEINQLSSQLREIKSKAGEDENGKPKVIPGLDETLMQLRTAEQQMYDWMKNYSENKAKLPTAQMQKFYEKELNKIQDIENSFENAIANAKAWLANNSKG
jgi:chromosome segregation ATPase